MSDDPKDVLSKHLFVKIFQSGQERTPAGKSDVFGMKKLKMPYGKVQDGTVEKDGQPGATKENK